MSAHAAALPPDAAALLGQDAALAEQAGSWTLAGVLGWLGEKATQGAAAPLRFAGQALLYLLLAGLAGVLCTASSWKKCLDAVAVLGFGVLCLSTMMELVGQVGQTAQESQTWLAAFVPVYSGVLVLGGQASGAAGYSGLFFSVSALLSAAIERLLLPVMRVYFCFAVSASLWGDAGAAEAARLFSRCLVWLLKGCGVLFSFVLGLQNILSGLSDNAAVRMGGSALAGAIPLVGDAAAAALSSAAGAVHLLKGSLALALVAALGGAFLPVFGQCMLYFLAFSGAGILAAGCGQAQCGRICRLLAEGVRICASILTLYFFMVFLSTALLLVLGNGG